MLLEIIKSKESVMNTVSTTIFLAPRVLAIL